MRDSTVGDCASDSRETAFFPDVKLPFLTFFSVFHEKENEDEHPINPRNKNATAIVNDAKIFFSCTLSPSRARHGRACLTRHVTILNVPKSVNCIIRERYTLLRERKKAVKIRNFAVKKSNNLYVQSLKYAIAGGVAFLVDFSALYSLTTYLHLHYLTSAAISYMLGSAVHYVLSILFIFDSRCLENQTLEFTIFALIGLVGLGMNEGVLWFFTEKVGLYYLYSKFIATFFIFFWNFSTRKFILFR